MQSLASSGYNVDLSNNLLFCCGVNWNGANYTELKFESINYSAPRQVGERAGDGGLIFPGGVASLPT